MPIYVLNDELRFPSPLLATEEGLLAIGGDLGPERLLLAYQNGIFPWYSDEDPILWWSPDPRLVLYPDQLRVSRSLKKTLRQNKFDITMDTRFREVIIACADIHREGQPGTWITHEMREAYCTLHELGYAHSVETWYQGRLAGGLYGVAMGGCFFGESMFSTVSDASKVALVCLCRFLQANDYDLIDCQLPTDHLISMGAVTIPRKEFLSQLFTSLKNSNFPGPWREFYLKSYITLFSN